MSLVDKSDSDDDTRNSSASEDDSTAGSSDTLLSVDGGKPDSFTESDIEEFIIPLMNNETPWADLDNREVRSEGKSSTSVSMPSTVLSISTFNEGYGSHVSLSFNKSDSQISGYRSKDNRQTAVAHTDTPNSCDSFLTASESDHQSPSRQKSHDLHSNITTTPVSSSNQSSNDNHMRGRGQDDSASTLCSNCSQVLLTARNRLSNASIDSGLSQSCVALPTSHVTGNDVPQDTPTKLTREIPTSQSTPIKPTMSAPQLAATMRKRKNFTKVLDKKQSHNLGIILSRIRHPFAEFKQALISFDSSFVAIDTWQAINDLGATEKEMTEIQDHMETNPKCLLDIPEEFLYNLHKISFGVERIRCILLKSRHEEALNDITSQLDNMNSVCDHMTNSKQIENLLSLLLAVGKFFNGGNNHQGQADGFNLEILPKLKHIKSKEQTSLLQYIANKYKSLYGDDSDAHADSSPHISSSYFTYTLPVPCVSKLVTAGDTSFDELSKTTNILNKELKDVESLMTKVEITLTDSSDNQTFYDVMSSFISQSQERITDLQKTLDTSKDGFSKMCQFYSAPTGGWQKIIPSQFFEPWISFSRDLSAVWEPVRNNPSRASAHF